MGKGGLLVMIQQPRSQLFEGFSSFFGMGHLTVMVHVMNLEIVCYAS